MSNYSKIESADDDQRSGERVQPKKIAIAKLVAARYLDQEAALLTAASNTCCNSEEVQCQGRVLAGVVAQLRSRADKLRGR